MRSTPFTPHIAPGALDDLRERLARTRWPEPDPAGGWEQGVNAGFLHALVEHWRHAFDWRAQERRMNLLPHFTAEVEGCNLHFVHQRGQGPRPLPLVLTHGWPSSFDEFAKIIPLLTDPAASGGDPDDSFDVIVPSLPGYGFSAPSPRPGLTTTGIAALWAELMSGLGYEKFCAHGGDIGAGVTNRLGLNHGDRLHGIHVMALLPPWLGEGSVPLTAAEADYRAVLDEWDLQEGAYEHLQRTRPQTLSYAVQDSPVGMAAWITEKLRNWSDCGGEIERRFSKDEILTAVSLYWLTGTFASSVRLYYDGAHFSPPLAPDAKITVPTGVGLTTERVNLAPRTWAERRYANLQSWTEFPRGGHFMAHEEPALLAQDLRAFFRRFR